MTCFGGECNTSLEESVGTIVDNNHHTNIAHIASATSICDFGDQVAVKMSCSRKMS